MNSWTRLRVSAGIWLLPLLLVVPWVELNPIPQSNRPVVIASSAIGNVMLVNGLVALAGAWEGLRFRMGGLIGGCQSRGVARILLMPWLITVASGWIPSVIYFWRVGAFGDAVGSWLSLAALVTLAAWGAVGLAIGLAFRSAVALPLALAVPTLWTILTPASAIPWPRLVAGYLADCCTAHRSLAPQALWAFGLFAVALLAASSCVAVTRWTARRMVRLVTTGSCLAMIVAVLIFCQELLAPLGYSPTVIRSDAGRCSATSSVRVCLMPENQDRLESVLKVANLTFEAWRAQGIPTPPLLTESVVTDPAKASELTLPPSNSPVALVFALASALTYAPCQSGSSAVVPIKVQQIQERDIAVLILIAGKSFPELRNFDRTATGLSPEAWRWADGKVAGSTEVVGQAVSADLNFLHSCR